MSIQAKAVFVIRVAVAAQPSGFDYLALPTSDGFFAA